MEVGDDSYSEDVYATTYWILGAMLLMVSAFSSLPLMKAAQSSQDRMAPEGIVCLGLLSFIYAVWQSWRRSAREKRMFTRNLGRKLRAFLAGLGAQAAWVLLSYCFSSHAEPLWKSGIGWSVALVCAALGSGLTCLAMMRAYIRLVGPQ